MQEMFSIIYTPTEGDAIQNFSRLFRKPEGCFLNINDQDRIEDNLSQWGDPEDIDYIVVSDGEEVQAPNPPRLFQGVLTGDGKILGIGDQGVGAILISVAKLVLATLCAGLHPSRTLPVVLDCGTNVRHSLATIDRQLIQAIEQRVAERRTLSRSPPTSCARGEVRLIRRYFRAVCT